MRRRKTFELPTTLPCPLGTTTTSASCSCCASIARWSGDEVAAVLGEESATLRKRFERTKEKLRVLAERAGLLNGER